MNYCTIRRSDVIFQSGPRLTVGIVAKTGPKSRYHRSFVPVVAIGRFLPGNSRMKNPAQSINRLCRITTGVIR